MLHETVRLPDYFASALGGGVRIPSGTPNHPDAALLALGERLTAAHAAAAAAHERSMELLSSFEDGCPDEPEALRCRAGDRDLCWRFASMVGETYDRADVESVRDKLTSGMETVGPRWVARVEARGAEIIAAWDAYLAADRTHADQIGMTAADEEHERLRDVVRDLHNEIMGTPPRTIVGLKVKAAAMMADGGVAGPLVRDVLTLGAVGDEEPGVAAVVVRLAAIRLRRLGGAGMPMAAE